MKKILNEFKVFISKGNVLDLAVGVLIGSSFSSLVTSLTENIISPIIGMFGSCNFDDFVLKINIGFVHLNLQYGAFLTDVINFVIMAFIVFLIVKFVNKITSHNKKKEELKPTKAENTILLEEIRDLLKTKKEKK